MSTIETITQPRGVADFIAATNVHDSDAVFATGAKIIDDRKLYGTADEIHDWITEHHANSRIVITPTSFEQGRLIASVEGDAIGNLAITLA